jgi:hypothetical protein
MRSSSTPKARPVLDLLAASQCRVACSTNTALAWAGGGHAFIGLYLAKQLLSDGHSVTILNDGAKVSAYPMHGHNAGSHMGA